MNGHKAILLSPLEFKRLTKENAILRAMLTSLIAPDLVQIARTRPPDPEDRVLIDASLDQVRAIVALLGPNVDYTGATPPPIAWFP
jgi:hypothetical protein